MSGETSTQTIWSLLITVVYSVISPVSVIVLARVLGSESFGVYAFAMAVVTLLAMAANLGFPSVLVRFVAEYYFRGDWARIRGLLGFANLSVVGASLGLIALLVFAVVVFLPDLNPMNRTALFLAAPLILILALEELRSSALKGLDRTLIGQIPEMIVRPGLFFTSVLLWFVLRGEVDVFEAVGLFLAAALVAFLVGAVLLLRVIRAPFREVKPLSERPVWIRTALPLLLLGSVQVLGAQMDIILMGLFRSSEETGVYRAAFQVSLLVTFAWIAVNTVIAPKLTRLHIGSDMKGFQTMVARANWVTFALAVPVALVCFLAGEYVLVLVFGAEFGAGYVTLVILVVGRLINALLGSSTTVLKMTGLEGVAMKGIVVGTLVNLVLNLVLIPPYGMYGAAIASTAGLVTWNLMLAYQVQYRLNINFLHIS